MAQTLPWASGRRKPAPGGRAKRRKRGRRRRLSLATIIWAVVTLALSVTFLIVQGMLLLIFTCLSLLITALAALADQTGSRDAVPAPKRAPPKSVNPRGNARSAGSSRQPGTAVACTRTGTPIDVCGCARRHVATSDGARRYKLAVGSPMGGRKPADPPVGEVMRKIG